MIKRRYSKNRFWIAPFLFMFT